MASSVNSDGRIDTFRLNLSRAALYAGRRWTWQIKAPGQTIGSKDMIQLDPDRRERDDEERRRRPGPEPREGRDADGAPVHARLVTLHTSAGPVVLTASAPRQVIERPIHMAMVPLLSLLGALSVVLALAALVQIRLGLRPLRQLRTAVAEVRSGRANAVPEAQPHELAPLAGELNALLRENDAALTTARASAANLAHALKTPVATLALELRGDPEASHQVARIDAVIRHHLSRTRDRVAGTRQNTVIAPAVADLAAMLTRLAADRAITVDQAIAPDLILAMDPADFDEVAGNLIDNAVRHAAQRVTVSAERRGAMIAIVVEDDGPGIPADARDKAMQPGVRLDERGEGHGFGLAIARELAELYGGSFALRDAASGGLRAELTLPARALPPA
jgi:signal transduction histidine kinase